MATQTIGSRRQVWNGTAKKTSGGLTKSHLMMSHGRIVSRAKHFSAKKEMRLVKHGYGSKKGKFGYVKLGTKKHRKGMRGGSAPLNPSSVNASYMIKDVVPQEFSPLDRALVGGRRRSSRKSRRGRRMRGGMAPLAPADANATSVGGLMSDAPVSSIGAGSTAVQMEAGQAGGRRRRRRMRGGTTSQRNPLSPMEVSSPLARALGAA